MPLACERFPKPSTDPLPTRRKRLHRTPFLQRAAMKTHGSILSAESAYLGDRELNAAQSMLLLSTNLDGILKNWSFV